MPHAHPSGFPSPSSVHSNARGGLSPALREKTALHRRAWALGCHTRIREGSPRHRFAARPRHPCSSGSSEALAYLPGDPDPFVIRRSQTTEGETHIMTMDNAGDRPPRYNKKRPPHRRARACPSPASARSNARGGQAPALRGKSGTPSP